MIRFSNILAFLFIFGGLFAQTELLNWRQENTSIDQHYICPENARVDDIVGYIYKTWEYNGSTPTFTERVANNYFKIDGDTIIRVQSRPIPPGNYNYYIQASGTIINNYTAQIEVKDSSFVQFVDPDNTGTIDGGYETGYDDWSDITATAGYWYLQKRGTHAIITYPVHAIGTGVDSITYGAYGNGSRPIISNIDNDRIFHIGGSATFDTLVKVFNFELRGSNVYETQNSYASWLVDIYCDSTTANLDNATIWNLSSQKCLFENIYLDTQDNSNDHGFKARGDSCTYINIKSINSNLHTFSFSNEHTGCSMSHLWSENAGQHGIENLFYNSSYDYLVVKGSGLSGIAIWGAEQHDLTFNHIYMEDCGNNAASYGGIDFYSGGGYGVYEDVLIENVYAYNSPYSFLNFFDETVRNVTCRNFLIDSVNNSNHGINISSSVVFVDSLVLENFVIKDVNDGIYLNENTNGVWLINSTLFNEPINANAGDLNVYNVVCSATSGTVSGSNNITTYDADSDTNYVDAADNDFTLTSIATGLIGQGLNIGSVSDIDGDNWKNPPSIGSKEFWGTYYKHYDATTKKRYYIINKETGKRVYNY